MVNSHLDAAHKSFCGPQLIKIIILWYTNLDRCN